MSLPFTDRQAAGRALGQRLTQLKLRTPIVVLALPRGGVPVGVKVARILGAALDLVLVRKQLPGFRREGSDSAPARAARDDAGGGEAQRPRAGVYAC